MSALDIEQAGQILRDYGAAVIDTYENGGNVYELDYVVRLEKCVRPEQVGICGNVVDDTLGLPYCELPSGHAGWHEARVYPPGLSAGRLSHWGRTGTDSVDGDAS